MKHTPGPWQSQYRAFNAEGFGIVSEETGKIVGVSYADTIRDRANADLIAAAPDLLAALEDAYTYVNNVGTYGDAWLAEKCKAAVAKAKGERE